MLYAHRYTSMAELKAAPLTTPKSAGKYWKGVRHWDTHTYMETYFTSRNWRVLNHLVVMSPDKADLAMCYVLDTRGEFTAPAPFRFAIGVTTSNARKALTRYYGGFYCPINDNEWTFGTALTAVDGKKHTTDFDPLTATAEGLQSLLVAPNWSERLHRQLTCKNLTKEQCSHQVLRTFSDMGNRDTRLSWTKVGEFYKTVWSRSALSYPSSWGLLMTFARMVCAEPPLRQMAMTERFAWGLPLY